MSKSKDRVVFRRVRGRIIPIREKRAAKSLAKAVDLRSAAVVGASLAAGAAGLFGAGRLARAAAKLSGKKELAFEQTAKALKFTSKFAPAAAIGSELVRIDRKTRADEQSKLFDIGNKTGAVNIALAAASGFAFARVGKRFEKFGLRGGKFPFKLKDI